MRTSETVVDLLADLIKCQAKISNPPANSVNDAFKRGNSPGSRYADLAALRDATMEHLVQHNLVIVQSTEVDGNGNFLCIARLYHKSGQWIECDYPLPNGTTQQIGSALTYARRYTWSAMLGVYCDKDDDGNAAEAASKVRPPTITARDINPYHKGGGPSEYVSRAPSQLLGSLLKECETLDEVDAWWLKHYKTNKDKLNHGSQCQLMEDMLHKGVDTATDSGDLNRFWNDFIKDIEYLGTMKPAEIDHLETKFKTKVEELSRFTSTLEAG